MALLVQKHEVSGDAMGIASELRSGRQIGSLAAPCYAC